MSLLSERSDATSPDAEPLRDRLLVLVNASFKASSVKKTHVYISNNQHKVFVLTHVNVCEKKNQLKSLRQTNNNDRDPEYITVYKC